MNFGHKFWDKISAAALQNCTDDFNELARECAVALALYKPTFDGSELTLLIQTVRPSIWPRQDSALIGYFRNSDTINWGVTMARQRNYFTSAANLFLPLVAHRGRKVTALRGKTHDKVCSYRSKIFGRKDILVSKEIVNAVRLLVEKI